MHQEIAQQMYWKLKEYGRVGAWVSRLLFGSGIAYGSHVLLEGPVQRFGEFSGTLLFGQGGLMALTRILRRPNWLAEMSRPTADTVRAIDRVTNPQDRAKLQAALTGLIIQAGKGKPTPIHPYFAWFLGPRNMALIAGAASLPVTAGEAKKRVQQTLNALETEVNPKDMPTLDARGRVQDTEDSGLLSTISPSRE
jgi:hypothetical protein